MKAYIMTMDLPKLLPRSLLFPSSGTSFARCIIIQVRGELSSHAGSTHYERISWLWCVVITRGATLVYAIRVFKISFANFPNPCTAAPPMGKICSISEHVLRALKRNDLPFRYIWIKHFRWIKHVIHMFLHNRVKMWKSWEDIRITLEFFYSTTSKNK